MQEPTAEFSKLRWDYLAFLLASGLLQGIWSSMIKSAHWWPNKKLLSQQPWKMAFDKLPTPELPVQHKEVYFVATCLAIAYPMLLPSVYELAAFYPGTFF